LSRRKRQIADVDLRHKRIETPKSGTACNTPLRYKERSRYTHINHSRSAPNVIDARSTLPPGSRTIRLFLVGSRRTGPDRRQERERSRPARDDTGRGKCRQGSENNAYHAGLALLCARQSQRARDMSLVCQEAGWAAAGASPLAAAGP